MDGTIHASVGCAFSSDDIAVAAMRALSDAGLVSTWRVGAADKERAEKIARATGARADIDPSDPLRGLAGVASEGDAAGGVNAGAALGAVAGAVGGFASGSTAIGAIMPVAPGMRGVAAAMLFFAIGAAVGGVLGGALGKRSSTHAGFRLIDAMEAGDVAAIGLTQRARTDDARRLLHDSGAADIIVIDARL